MQRALIVLGGLLVLIIIVIVFASLLSGGSNINTSLVSLTAQQNELARVATLGTQQAVGQDTKNFAISVQLSVSSDQQQLINYLKTQGHKVGTKELLADQSTKTDSQLTDATSNSTFDSTFDGIVQSQLTSYAQAVKTAFGQATGKNARALLNTEYQNAQLLLKQVPANPSS